MLFVKAVLMGLAIAAPLGPIGALCIQRTLQRGLLAGVAGGLGTALADALYASFAAAGFATFAATLTRISTPLGLFGGGFLFWLAWKGWPRGAAPKAAATAAAGSLAATIATTFALTMANPATILSFAAIFAGIGLADTASATGAIVVVAGVFSGSMLWWLILTGSVAALHRRLPTSFARWVARASSLMMAAFGVWAIAQALT